MDRKEVACSDTNKGDRETTTACRRSEDRPQGGAWFTVIVHYRYKGKDRWGGPPGTIADVSYVRVGIELLFLIILWQSEGLGWVVRSGGRETNENSKPP